jgi:mono/diheme cytochrome c family protein
MSGALRMAILFGSMGLATAVFVPKGAFAADKPSSVGEARTRPADAGRQPSAYLGWRLFQQRCSDCHGLDASGTERAPDLRTRVADMSESRFVARVLYRYTWIVPSGEVQSESSAREALVEQVLQGKKGNVAMPAWRGEPSVTASIGDLYAYLRGRADGTIGSGRPAP